MFEPAPNPRSRTKKKEKLIEPQPPPPSDSSLSESYLFSMDVLENKEFNYKNGIYKKFKQTRELLKRQNSSNKLSAHFGNGNNTMPLKYKDNEEEIKQQQGILNQKRRDSKTEAFFKMIDQKSNQAIVNSNQKTSSSIFQSPAEVTSLTLTDDPFQTEAIETTDLTEEDKLKQEIKNLRPAYRPLVYNLAYFVNDNQVLQTFVKMGVAIRQWDKHRSTAELMLKLDLEQNVKPIIIFLHDLCIQKQEDQAVVIEKNPMIFAQEMANLNARINYLKSKRFGDESISSMILKAPLLLNLSVEDLDTKLGWYQNEFSLTGNELRQVVTEMPKLAIQKLDVPAKMAFSLGEILGYDAQFIKKFILAFPKLFTKEFQLVEQNFIYLTQVCKLTHTFIATFPPVLVVPLHLLKSRYAYLKYLNRAQFEPTKPNFISLKSLIEPDEIQFCRNSAKTSSEQFKKFLKTV
jgi:mTERF domain-containing protein